MATKDEKTAAGAPAAKAAPAAPADPWQELREVTLPRHGRNEQNFQWVSVNDRHFQIPRDGRPHAVPLPIWEVVCHARAMADYAADRSEAMRRELRQAAEESARSV